MSPNSDFIPFGKPLLGKEEENSVLEVLRSGWLTTGKKAHEFEEDFARFVGTPAALAVNSNTSGLELALEAFGVGTGDTVVTTPYTFVATASTARHLGAEVVFCDIAPDDYNIDPEKLETILRKTKNIKAVLPVHVGGMPCKMDAILALADKYGFKVIEDAAHAFPVKLNSGYAGTLGDAGVYSFYANKTITTGEGGMVVARDPAVRKHMSIMRTHGFDRDAWDRYTSPKASWYYDVVAPGYKFNLPDVLAAIGVEQLKKANAFRAMRAAIAERYLKAFGAENALLNPPVHPAHSWHLFSLRLRPEALRISRDDFIVKLQEKGIGTSVHFIPLHTMKYWRERYNLKPSDYPEALDKFEHTISLPIYQGMTEAQVDRVIEAVLAIVNDSRA